ncbi:SDR family oxidoreductase [Nocardia sp. NPDC056611]|uniref:SDR family oxidoreductase n=1 Tax=Nocardia sp. NPDC056611 TaxID=3345877 RepID=UPI00366E2BE0
MAASGELSGKVALVTGGAGGVGSAVVGLLARRGATVYLNCFHSFAAGKQQAEQLTAAGHDVRVLRGSVGKPDHVERMIAEIGATSGRLDVLVNNAALGLFGSAATLTEDDIDRTWNINVKGPLRCSQAARALMTASGGGSIVNLSSIGSTRVLRDYLAIGLSKAALESLTRYLAVEFAADGIRVNTASGGLLDTPGARMFPDSTGFATTMADRTPFGRLGQADEIAEVVGFLASDRSAWMTGQTVTADGGLGLPLGAFGRGQEAAAPPEQTDAAAPHAAAATAPDTASQLGHDPIVVVGMGLAAPGVNSPDEFWQVLCDGPALFSEATPDRWQTSAFTPGRRDVPDKGYQPVSGIIQDFRPHPGLAAEPDHGERDFNTLWLRHSLYQALESVTRRAEDRYTLSVGLTCDGSQHRGEHFLVESVRLALTESGTMTEDQLRTVKDALLKRFPRAVTTRTLPHDIAADAIDGILPAATPVFVVDTACSSSLYALDRAVRDLREGRTDIAVCGGSHAQRVANMVAFAQLGGLSPTGEIRALDETSDGVLFADGAGILVLKRLSRALADADQVLGVISGIGLSADGKGKAINAPSTPGQVAAARRALADSGIDAGDVGLVIAHATGTPAGDNAELLGIAQVYSGQRPVPVVANKSIIGHTGWAAGALSLIHLLLTMRHGHIPAQPRFTRLRDKVAEHASHLTVPREPAAWPRPVGPGRVETPRIGAVSGFGFGGTNATVIVSEYLPRHAFPAPSERPDHSGDPLVIVGWSKCEPDDLDYGEQFPAPPFESVRMPPRLVRSLDRSQLLAIQCVHALPARVLDFCSGHRDTTGVIVGFMGQTQAMGGIVLRTHLDDIADVLAPEPVPGIPRFLEEFRQAVEAAAPPLTADSYPGAMPNLIASRICNYFDLRGLNLLVDTGETALLQVFQAAEDYLRSGDLDLALVAGVSANATPAWASEVRGDDDRPIAEGAYLFAVTRESLARTAGLDILTRLETSIGEPA